MMFPVYLASPTAVPTLDPTVFYLTAMIPTSGLYLHIDEHGVALCQAGAKGQVRVDFVHGAAHYRRTKGGGELIARAVQHTSQPVVWDATGGLGRDAFVLASLGLSVTVFEQHPVVAYLLADGLTRAQQHPDTANIAQRIHFQHGDAVQLMPQLLRQLPRPDVVYLDPMYPTRQKSAAVKKEMAYFHQLVGTTTTYDDAQLLQVAQQIATKRIVVKRPRLGECLAQRAPAYQYSGKSTRFDVYLPHCPTD